MATSDGSRVIAIEEHYFDPALSGLFAGRDDRMPPPIRERLLDVGEGRLKAMDEGGIDVQVLSHGAPATQKLDAETGAAIAREVNDRLAGIVAANPERFQGFAALPTANPAAAADELDRCVGEHGFKGAMVHGLTNGAFLDEKRFWPIFERAAALGVPLYMHPSIPHEDVIQAYYADYIEAFPGLLTAGWGFTVETATQGIRLVLSGVFDAYPDLRIVLGHLGEGLPFLLWRIDQALSRTETPLESFRETFREHFYITTSGNFSDPALLCSAMEMGTDRILFSVDYP
ncbi:MAG: amidohydrolase family protein, partial [Defluviicoccus sp.]|nr:amidohydrolase family protein [Defluviicoccus sp.]